MLVDAAKAAALLFCAALIQVTIVSSVSIAGGRPDLVLLSLAAVALLRGSIFGAVCGFYVGLVVDTALLETLGLSSLLLTLVGYWVGRYAETTHRDRMQTLLLSVAAATVVYVAAGLGLRFLLATPVDARVVLLDSLLPQLALNLLLMTPVYSLFRLLLAPVPRAGVAPEARLLG